MVLRLSKGISQSVVLLLRSAAESQSSVKLGLASTAVQILSVFQASHFPASSLLQVPLFTENPDLPPTCLVGRAGSLPPFVMHSC